MKSPSENPKRNKVLAIAGLTSAAIVAILLAVSLSRNGKESKNVDAAVITITATTSSAANTIKDAAGQPREKTETDKAKPHDDGKVLPGRNDEIKSSATKAKTSPQSGPDPERQTFKVAPEETVGGNFFETCYPNLAEGTKLTRIQMAMLIFDTLLVKGYEIPKNISGRWKDLEIVTDPMEIEKILTDLTADQCDEVKSILSYIAAARKMFEGDKGCFNDETKESCEMKPDRPINAAETVTVVCRAFFREDCKADITEMCEKETASAENCKTEIEKEIGSASIPSNWQQSWYTTPLHHLFVRVGLNENEKEDLKSWLTKYHPVTELNTKQVRELLSIIPVANFLERR